jgi:uncharacterized membrane protein
MHPLALALDPYVRDWLDLLIRWLHVIAAIAWIGSSFYFVLLDQSLRAPTDQQDIDDGVGGELWEIHGGGFYHVKKYKVAPPALPDHLAWFKWEAYTTWLSGFSLFVVLYWADARTYMIDPSIADIGPWTAVGISAALLAGAWIVYDLLCRALGTRELALAACLLAGTVVAAWGTGQLFSPRAAWLQTGAMLGTIMAANVFFNIIPAHWELIRAKEQGRDPDPAPGIEAKRRSVHNNYFTLPVLVTMLAGHFTFLTGKHNAWAILVALMLLGALIRHFFNTRHAGTTHWWIPAVVAVSFVALAVGLRPAGDEKAAAPQPQAAHAMSGSALFRQNCAGCHTLADANTHGHVGPNLDQAQPSADLVRDRVSNGQGGMPPFQGKLTAEQIDALAAYVSGAAGSKQ